MAIVPFVVLSLAAAAPFAYPAFPANEDFTTVAAWTARRTDVPVGDLVDVRDGLAFVVLPAVAPRGPRTIRIEALDTQAWRRIGGRSAELHAVLDCEPPALSLGSVDIYAASNRLGDARRGAAPGVLKLSPGTSAIVAAALCSPPIQARPPAAITLDEPAPKPSPLPLAAIEDPPVLAPPPDPPPSRPGRVVAAQVGAFSTAAAARKALEGLAADRPELERRVEPFRQGRRVVYRALLAGFATPKDARGFCRALIKRRRSCTVRPPARPGGDPSVP